MVDAAVLKSLEKQMKDLRRDIGSEEKRIASLQSILDSKRAMLTELEKLYKAQGGPRRWP
jgi:septal ring factor EnvC (AmiA/AmiB activator)